MIGNRSPLSLLAIGPGSLNIGSVLGKTKFKNFDFISYKFLTYLKGS